MVPSQSRQSTAAIVMMRAARVQKKISGLAKQRSNKDKKEQLIQQRTNKTKKTNKSNQYKYKGQTRKEIGTIQVKW